jgi:exonuclease III
VAHLDLDIYNHGAKHVPKVPGCTPEERSAQTALLESGWVDVFRSVPTTVLILTWVGCIRAISAVQLQCPCIS